MNFAHKNKQLNTALNFANALLDRTGNAKMKESAKRVKTIAERNPSVACPYDGAKYHGRYKGTVCKICDVCQIGAPASGLRLVG
jgi:coatomer protein complex subunit alpha (xenin)